MFVRPSGAPLILAILCSAILLQLGTPVSAGELPRLTADEIAVRAYNRDEGRDVVMDQKMILGKKGKTPRERKIRLWRIKDEKGNEKTLMRFLEPADVRGTGFLVWSYADPNRDDDQWLYLPALHRVRRIAAQERSRSFMGTDFTYDDLGDRKPSEDTHRLVGTEIVDGRSCYVIEAIPKDEGYLYSRRVAWIDGETFLVLKADFFDRKGKLLKRFHADDIQVIDGIATPRVLVMTNEQTGHSTRLELSNIRYNTGLKEELFTVSELENP